MSLRLDQRTATPAAPVPHARPGIGVRLRDMVKAMRPRQWLKNTLLFGALLSSGQIVSARPLVACVVGFVAFCAASSSVYLLNDVLDREMDAQHPTKRHRPIAAGRLAPRPALVLAGILALASLGLAATQAWAFLLLLALFLAMQVAYCVRLRSEPILDIVVVAVGFLIRAVGGGVVSDIHLTAWFLAVMGFGALFVVTGKRASEVARVKESSGPVRKVGTIYTPSFLRTVGMTALSITVITYCLWAFGRYESGAWILAVSVVPFVIAVLRYAQLIDAGMAEAPEEAILSDRLIRWAGVAWVTLFVADAAQTAWQRGEWLLLGSVTFVVTTLAIVYTGWLLAWRAGLRRIGELLIGAIVLATAEIVVLSLTVGQIPGGFRVMPLGIAIAAIALACHLWIGRSALRHGRRQLRAVAGYLARMPRRHTLVTLFAVLVIIWYAARLLLVLRLPIYDYDGLWYHMIGPDTWVMEGRVTRVTHVIWSEVYPANTELLLAWPGVFLRTMHLAGLAQFPFCVLGAIAVATLSRRFGAKRPASIMMGLLFASIPAVIAEASTALVDVSFAACALAGLVLLLGVGTSTSQSHPPYGRLAIAGASIGLAVGMKSSGLLVWGVLGAALAIWLLFSRRKTGWSYRAIIWATTGFGAIAVALGAFWYARTWWFYGNPFYPVTMFGFRGQGTVAQLFMDYNTPDEIRDARYGFFGQLWHSWKYDLAPNYGARFNRQGGLGMFWLPLVVPGAIAGFLITVRRRKAVVPMLVSVALASAVLFATPAAWWPRYILITAGVAIAALGVVTSRAGKWPARLVAVALVVTATLSSGGVVMDPLVKLSLSKTDPAKDMWGWDMFGDYDRVIPAGSVIGIIPPAKEFLVHPMIGTQLRRRLVVIPSCTDLATFDAELSRAGARYVVLDEDTLINRLVRDAPQRYRRIYTKADNDYGWTETTIFRHRLYEVLPG